MQRQITPPEREARQGNMLLIGMVSISALLGMVALGVELGQGWMVRKEVQKAVEAGTKAGAFTLDGTDAGLAAAQGAAVQYANLNFANGHNLTVQAADVEFGTYDGSTGVYTSVGDLAAATGNADTINAVVLQNSVNVGTGFAGAIFGTTSIAPTARALGVRQGVAPETATCFLPLAVPECFIYDAIANGTDLEDIELVLSNSTVNNAAWAGSDSGTPNANYLKSTIEGWEDNSCETDGTSLSLNDDVGLNNGTVASAFAAMDSAIENSSQTWDPAIWDALPSQDANSTIQGGKYGRVLEGPIMMIDAGAGFCSSPGPLSGSAPISGWIQGAIYDVRKDGGTREIVMRFNTVVLDDDGITGGNSGGDVFGSVFYQSSNPYY